MQLLDELLHELSPEKKRSNLYFSNLPNENKIVVHIRMMFHILAMLGVFKHTTTLQM